MKMKAIIAEFSEITKIYFIDISSVGNINEKIVNFIKLLQRTVGNVSRTINIKRTKI